MNIISNKNLIILVLIGFILAIFELVHFSDKECVVYMTNHINEMEKADFYLDDNDHKFYKIVPKDSTLINGYYTAITIRENIKDTSFYIICWGDRDNWMWNFRGDKIFKFNKYGYIK